MLPQIHWREFLARQFRLNCCSGIQHKIIEGARRRRSQRRVRTWVACRRVRLPLRQSALEDGIGTSA